MPNDTPSTPDKEPDFETALKELESIVTKLEDGDISLDESLKHFERGVKLTRQCQGALAKAEQKVDVLTKEGNVEPFSPGTEEE